MNDWERSLRHERYHHHHQQQQQHQQRSQMPSFSSSLLDAIYRSIDEKSKDETTARTTATTTKAKKQRNSNSNRNDAAEDESHERSLRKALTFEKWMERNDEKRGRGFSRTCNSASSSSDSSCGGVFSSSETEFVHRDGTKSVSFTIQRPKAQVGRDCYSGGSEYENTPKREGRLLMRTKSKAMKLYGDLKKVKQPISPGRRITSFLNSLFNSGTVKNRKRESLDSLSALRRSRSVKDHQTTTCSLSSSFSRSSCLNKLPPSSTSRANNKFTSSSNNSCSKRSVRFCLVDEDPRRCGKKEDPRITPTPIVRKIAEITVIEKEVIKNMNIDKCRSRGFEDEDLDDLDEDDEEFDDGMSCTSSDLFELENIGDAGVGSAYREELPVYGTTSLKKNHAIVNGLINSLA